MSAAEQKGVLRTPYIPDAAAWRPYAFNFLSKISPTSCGRSAPRVVRAARQFQAEGSCDYAEDRQFTAADGTL